MENMILILEDSLPCQKIAAESLNKIAQTKSVSTVKEARDFLKSHKVDMVLLDMSLPDGDGLEFYYEMQTILNLSSLPVLFISGNDDISKKVAAFSSGAQDYLVKPYSPMELRARVERVFKNNKPDDIFKEEISGLVLDFSKYRANVNSNGQSIDLKLTPHEFKILYLLIKSPQQIFSRQKILDRVWGPDVFLTPRTVDAHISGLRKKISSLNLNLVSVRSEGYKMELGIGNKSA